MALMSTMVSIMSQLCVQMGARCLVRTHAKAHTPAQADSSPVPSCPTTLLASPHTSISRSRVRCLGELAVVSRQCMQGKGMGAACTVVAS